MKKNDKNNKNSLCCDGATTKAPHKPALTYVWLLVDITLIFTRCKFAGWFINILMCLSSRL